jgi:benzil reductase ((S)-benzoin forming)
MKQNLHIITGGSRGLGFEMAKFLADKGDRVISLSRTNDLIHHKIKTIRIDLSKSFSSAELFDSIIAENSLNNFDQLSLINNAGMIDPISPAKRVDKDLVEHNIALNLTAPILLAGEFLKRTEGHTGKRVVFNVSSGVARRPKISWSVYSAAKAGLEAFSAAVQKELSSDANAKVITFDPGIMDTAMQERIRSSSEADFPELKRFIGFKENGELLDPSRAGRIAARVVLGEIANNQPHVLMEELISAGH